MINNNGPSEQPFSVPFRSYLCRPGYRGPRLEQRIPAGEGQWPYMLLPLYRHSQKSQGSVGCACDSGDMGLPESAI